MTDIDSIKAIQQTLKDAGLYDKAIDGVWGAASQAGLNGLLLRAKAPPASFDGVNASTPLNDADKAPVDARSESNIATLLPPVQPLARALVNRAKSVGIKIVITSGTRTYAEQDALYEQGRSRPGQIVTSARGGFSSHNHKIAVDFTVFEGASPKWEGPEYTKVGKIAEALGLSWGGRWSNPDEPHVYLKPYWAKDISESQMMAALRSRHAAGTDAFA